MKKFTSILSLALGLGVLATSQSAQAHPDHRPAFHGAPPAQHRPPVVRPAPPAVHVVPPALRPGVGSVPSGVHPVFHTGPTPVFVGHSHAHPYRGTYAPPSSARVYSGWRYGRVQWNVHFYAYHTYRPTLWVYYPGTRSWHCPQYGSIVYQAPAAYYGPITVVVNETVYEEVQQSVWDYNQGNWVTVWRTVPRTVTWYYNAYYYEGYGRYGYYDLNANFHWLP